MSCDDSDEYDNDEERNCVDDSKNEEVRFVSDADSDAKCDDGMRDDNDDDEEDDDDSDG